MFSEETDVGISKRSLSPVDLGGRENVPPVVFLAEEKFTLDKARFAIFCHVMYFFVDCLAKLISLSPWFSGKFKETLTVLIMLIRQNTIGVKIRVCMLIYSTCSYLHRRAAESLSVSLQDYMNNCNCKSTSVTSCTLLQSQIRKMGRWN